MIAGTLTNYNFKQNVYASNIPKTTTKIARTQLDDTVSTVPIFNPRYKHLVDRPDDAKILFEDHNLVSYAKIDHHNIQKGKTNKIGILFKY